MFLFKRCIDYGIFARIQNILMAYANSNWQKNLMMASALIGVGTSAIEEREGHIVVR